MASLGSVNFQRPVPKNAGRSTVVRSSSYGDRNYEDMSQYTSDGSRIPSNSQTPTLQQNNLRRVAQQAREEMMTGRTMSATLGGVSGMLMINPAAKAKSASASPSKPNIPTPDEPKRKAMGKARGKADPRDEVSEFFGDEEPESRPRLVHAKTKAKTKAVPLAKPPAKKAAATFRAEEEEPEEEDGGAESASYEDGVVPYERYAELARKVESIEKLCVGILKNYKQMAGKLQEVHNRITETEGLWKHKLNDVDRVYEEFQTAAGSYQAQFAELHAKIGDKDIVGLIENIKFDIGEAKELSRWFWALTVANTPVFADLPSKGSTNKTGLRKFVTTTLPIGTSILCYPPEEYLMGVGFFFRCRVVDEVDGKTSEFYVPFKLRSNYFVDENIGHRVNPKTGLVTCLAHFDVVHHGNDAVDLAEGYASEDEEEEETQQEQNNEEEEGYEEERVTLSTKADEEEVEADEGRE